MTQDVTQCSAASLGELAVMKSAIEQEIAAAQDKIKIIKNEIESRYLERAQDKLHQQGKDFGSVSVIDGAHKVKFNVRKRVEWEQPVLGACLDRLSPEDARHYAKVSITIPEAKYNSAPPEIQAILSEARTVHLQGISVDIEESDDA